MERQVRMAGMRVAGMARKVAGARQKTMSQRQLRSRSVGRKRKTAKRFLVMPLTTPMAPAAQWRVTMPGAAATR